MLEASVRWLCGPQRAPSQSRGGPRHKMSVQSTVLSPVSAQQASAASLAWAPGLSRAQSTLSLLSGVLLLLSCTAASGPAPACLRGCFLFTHRLRARGRTPMGPDLPVAITAQEGNGAVTILTVGSGGSCGCFPTANGCQAKKRLSNDGHSEAGVVVWMVGPSGCSVAGLRGDGGRGNTSQPAAILAMPRKVYFIRRKL
ncbi:hypothetical protein NDU88_001698 [Pleurodeles waltl]|uniref:Uncharacterized protein n=1 Tax=Pleurodeles waltl TaxID=8319 RepID=A0AAV7U960_PLEWA|nr:hypothetical protein NDU88_001698 [Pleurodeles waltl]